MQKGGIEMPDVISLDKILYGKQSGPDETGHEPEGGFADDKYADIFDKILQLIIDNNSEELAKLINANYTASKLQGLIEKYINNEGLNLKGVTLKQLSKRLYNDMADVGFARVYLDDPGLEELNINGWNGTWAIYGDRKERLPDAFSSALSCVNTVKKMARMGGAILDKADPIADSYITKGVRVSGAISPVIDEDIGAVASIRKQKHSFINKDMLISLGTTTEEQLLLLSTCINNRVSVAIAGNTGSGKTSYMNYLLSTVDYETRIITIEDTKELDLIKYDNNNPRRQINDVIQMYTKEPPNPVTMADLLRHSLRFHPALLVPAEMRGAEAKTAVEAARTGHTALTSLHADSAIDAYDRILTMYLMEDTKLTEERILKLIVKAFPIILFKMQFPDKSRKVTEIFEATGVESGNVLGHPLYKYITTGTEKDENGKITKMYGKHIKCGPISDNLAEKFRLLGVGAELIGLFKSAGNDTRER